MDEEYVVNRCEDLDWLIDEILKRYFKSSGSVGKTIKAFHDCAGDPEELILNRYPPDDYPGLAGSLVVRDWKGVVKFFLTQDYNS